MSEQSKEKLYGPFSFDQVFNILTDCRVGWIDGRMLLPKDLFSFLSVMSHNIRLASFFFSGRRRPGFRRVRPEHMVIHSNGCQLMFPVQPQVFPVQSR